MGEELLTLTGDIVEQWKENLTNMSSVEEAVSRLREALPYPWQRSLRLSKSSLLTCQVP